MRNFFIYIKGNRVFFFITLFIGTLYSVNSVVIPNISGMLITSVIANITAAQQIIFLYLCAYLFQLIISQLDTFMSEKFKIRQKSIMRNCAYASYSSLRSEQSREAVASAVSYINNDIPNLVEQYFSGTYDIFKCICLILFSTVSLFSIHWILAIEILVFSLLIVYFPTFMKQKGSHAREEVSNSLKIYNLHFQSFLSGLPVLKAYGYRARSNILMQNYSKEVVNKESALLKNRIIVYGTTAFLQLSKDALILVSSVILIAKGTMEVGNLVTVLQLASLLASPVEVLASLRHARNEAAPLLETYSVLMAHLNSIRKDMQHAGIEEKDCFHELSLNDVSCATNNLTILNHISYTFYEGKKYLITGESGSGKSTLIKVLSRVSEIPFEGELLLNNKTGDNLPDFVYYSYVCPVFQTPYLFYATIEENILLGRNIPHEVYLEVVDKLNLGYLLKRYKGMEFSPEIVEKLSGGEKQRISLARAMVGKPKVYLLDEVTSSLDEKNAENIESVLLHENAAVIFVSHRTAEQFLSLYAKHLIMDHGSLLEVNQ